MEHPRHHDASLLSLFMGSYDLVSPFGLAYYELPLILQVRSRDAKGLRPSRQHAT
jgi:hypothetical protein